MNKIYNTSIEVKEIDNESRTITAIGSKETIDRDGDVIKVDGVDFKKYKTNPVVLYSHDSRELPIGKTVKVWVDSDKLMFKIQFATAEENPKAEYVYKLFKGGYLKAFSIGFIPNYSDITYVEDKKTKKSVRYINSSELLEISAVSLPSNREALIQTFEKAWQSGDIDGEALKSLQDELDKVVDIQPISSDVIDKQLEVLQTELDELKKYVSFLEKELEDKDTEDPYETIIQELQEDEDTYKELVEELQ